MSSEPKIHVDFHSNGAETWMGAKDLRGITRTGCGNGYFWMIFGDFDLGMIFLLRNDFCT